MNSNIKQVVDAAIQSTGYRVPFGGERVVNAVVEALSAKAEEIADTLRVEGERLGASTEQVEAALVSSGLVEAQPEPEVEESSSDGDRLGKIEATLERLVNAARSRGLSI